MDRLERIKTIPSIENELIGDVVRLEVTDRDWLISEIEQLRRDLRCYGSHSNLCKIIEGGSAYEQCDCGFEQVLKEGGCTIK